MLIRLTFALITLAFFSLNSIKQGEPKLSPELQKALDDFEMADGLKIELVAAEPLISDPVAMEIDEDGRIVVMPDGLENAISLTDMADLLAYIKGLK